MQTIVLASPLPAITQPVIIDGFSQPGSSANTQPAGQGLNAVLQIQIDGTGAVNEPCIQLFAGNDDVLETVIQGLVINRCPVGAIHVGVGGERRADRRQLHRHRPDGDVRARARRASASASSTRRTSGSAARSRSSAI